MPKKGTRRGPKGLNRTSARGNRGKVRGSSAASKRQRSSRGKVRGGSAASKRQRSSAVGALLYDPMNLLTGAVRRRNPEDAVLSEAVTRIRKQLSNPFPKRSISKALKKARRKKK